MPILTAEDIAEINRRTGAPPMSAALAKVGVSADSLAQQLAEELRAVDTKFFAHEGMVVDSRDVVAWKIRQEARRDGIQYLGLEPAKRHELAGPNGSPVNLAVRVIFEGTEAQEPESVDHDY